MTRRNCELRDEEELNVFSDRRDQIGFGVMIQDSGTDLEDVYSNDPVDVQVKPHPQGYQISVWWTAEDGETRKENDVVVRTEDPRDQE